MGTTTLSDVVNGFRSSSPAQKAVSLCAGFLFLHFYAACAFILVVDIWAICQKDLRKELLCLPGRWWFGGFLLLAVTIPLVYRWYLGFAAGIGLVAVLLFMSLARIAARDDFVMLIADICCIAGIIPFLYGIGEKLWNGPSFRATGGMLNANYYGAVLEFCILLCVWRMLDKRQRRGRYVSLIAMNVTGIFLCDCQSAWLALIGGVLVLLFLTGRRKAGVLFCAAAIFLVLLGVTIPGILPRLDLLPQTAATRFAIWKTALLGIRDHPLFGQGTLTYFFAYPRYGGYPTYHAHSIYLDSLLSFGIIGTVLLLGGFTAVYWRVCGNLRNPRHKQVSILILAMTAAVLLHGFTDAAILWVQTGGLFCLILGAGTASGGKNGIQKASR